MTLSMLIAYDAAGNVVATLDYVVARDAEGNAIGLVDFEAHELTGGELTDIWYNELASGSKTWPEWIGMRAHDFRVELDGPAGRKRIAALVHRRSGHRRQRAAVETAIADRITAAGGEPADIRDLVGGPEFPLVLDDEGRTLGRSPRPQGAPAGLPVLRRPGKAGQVPGGADGDRGG